MHAIIYACVQNKYKKHLQKGVFDVTNTYKKQFAGGCV